MNQYLRALGLIALHCGYLSLFPRPVSAQSFPLLDTTQQQLKQASALPLEFNNDSAPTGFDGQGRPRSRTSGGSRGSCSELVVALVPGSGEVIDSTTACTSTSLSALAATLESNPTLWFHIPAQTQIGVTAEFVLLNNDGQVLSSEIVTLPEGGGIMDLQLDHSLETDRVYHWIFSILNYPNPSQNPTVEGSLERIVASSELSMALAINQAQSERIQVLAQYGIWHDTLHELALLYQAEPNNSRLQNNWLSLLKSVGLEAIAQKVPVDCCAN